MAWIDIPQENKRTFTKVSYKHLKQLNRTKKKLSAGRLRRRIRRKQERLARQIGKGWKPPKYEQYIHSDEWRLRRLTYWKEHGQGCKACGSLEQPTVHHTHYGYVGREKDAHIVGLCWPCHKEFHDRYGTKVVMQQETASFIAEKKLSPPT